MPHTRRAESNCRNGSRRPIAGERDHSAAYSTLYWAGPITAHAPKSRAGGARAIGRRDVHSFIQISPAAPRERCRTGRPSRVRRPGAALTRARQRLRAPVRFAGGAPARTPARVAHAGRVRASQSPAYVALPCARAVPPAPASGYRVMLFGLQAGAYVEDWVY